MNKSMPTTQKGRLDIRIITQIGMLSAIAVVLMLFEFPLPFAPGFYKIDLSEVPVLIGCFTMGPIAGIIIEFVKILLNLLINGTITMGIGEAANFLIGISLCVPAGMIYRKQRSRKGALLGMTVGTISMTILGSLVNAYVLLPFYAKMMFGSIDAIIDFGAKINPAITSLTTFILFAVAPFNLVKGMIVSLVVFLIYKKISPVFKGQK